MSNQGSGSRAGGDVGDQNARDFQIVHDLYRRVEESSRRTAELVAQAEALRRTAEQQAIQSRTELEEELGSLTQDIAELRRQKQQLTRQMDDLRERSLQSAQLFERQASLLRGLLGDAANAGGSIQGQPQEPVFQVDGRDTDNSPGPAEELSETDVHTESAPVREQVYTPQPPEEQRSSTPVEVTAPAHEPEPAPAPETTPEPDRPEPVYVQRAQPAEEAPPVADTQPVTTSEEPAPVAPAAPSTVQLVVHGLRSVPNIVRVERAVRSIDSISEFRSRQFANGVLNITVATNDTGEQLLDELLNLEPVHLQPVRVEPDRLELSFRAER